MCSRTLFIARCRQFALLFVLLLGMCSMAEAVGPQEPVAPVGQVEVQAVASQEKVPNRHLSRDWYFKPSYPNYAPHQPGGMPDFDMKQDNWKCIFPGPNGMIDSSPSGDDIYDPTTQRIAPGPDKSLESTPVADDYADWSFSGPAALANCLWWFDSKYADPSGYPGDGDDQFPLVEGYDQLGSKVVDQQLTIFMTDNGLSDAHWQDYQSFTPTVNRLDAIQIYLKSTSSATTVEINVYDEAFGASLGSSQMNPGYIPGGMWLQFHFDPPISMTPEEIYYFDVVQDIYGMKYKWGCNEMLTDSYPRGQGWSNGSAVWYYDWAFKTEYYAITPLDDHEAANVPYLIEDLAEKICVTTTGVADPAAMQATIDQWFVDKGLDDSLEETTYEAPSFEFIEEEIERSQDVVLLLGFFDLDSLATKLVDQEQDLCTAGVYLYLWPPGHLQEFVPTVNILDAVQLALRGNETTPTTVEVSIYDMFPADAGVTPIGVTSMVVSVTVEPLWFQFHFDPPIVLTPGELYYLAVKALDNDFLVQWCYVELDAYPSGIAWFNYDQYDLQDETEWDFAFRTEYYGGSDCVRTGQHYVTCAGVNSAEYLIAFSDPLYDITDPGAGDHNDAQNVSHDIYAVSTFSPCPELSYECYLPHYPTSYRFTIVEQAIVICPIDTVCDCTPGDADGNGTINISDAVYLIRYIFIPGPPPTPYAICSGDADCNCIVNVSDAVYLINYIFSGGPAPCDCYEWLTICGPPLR